MQTLTENVTVLGNRHFNYFVVGRKTAALIECGTTAGAYSFKQEWDVWTGRPHIAFMLAMHAHFDHVCGIPALREILPQALLLASRRCEWVLNNPKIMKNFFAQDAWLTDKLYHEGLLEEVLSSPQVDRIKVDRVVDPGDILRLENNIELEVIYAPGHSPCSIACYLPCDQIMFLSDAAGFQISDTAIFPAFFHDYHLYVDTIKRLRDYPTQILGLPHETIWHRENVRAFYDRALAEAWYAYRMIEAMLQKDIEEKEISSLLFNHYYRGQLEIYTPENIQLCVDLLIRRVKACL